MSWKAHVMGDESSIEFLEVDLVAIGRRDAKQATVLRVEKPEFLFEVIEEYDLNVESVLLHPLDEKES